MAPEDLFNNMSNVPAVVEKVNFEGIKRTKDDVFHSVTKFMMKGKTFDDMMINIGEMQQELIRIGVVRDVSTKLDVGKGDFGYVLTFKIKEPGSVSGGIHTTVGNAEGGVSLKLNFPNTFGRGERFVADIGYGSRSKTDLNMSFYKPYVFKNVLDIGLSAYRRSMMFDASGLKAHDHGIGFNIMRVLGDYTISKTSVEPFIRHVTSCDYKTPFELRNNCGWFFQTSIKHELTRDTRKETILPHYGSLARVSMELSHGYHTFIKTDVQTQVNLPLSEYLSVQASTHAGYIQSLGSKSPHLMDKFFLGGPLILRGFHPFHAGPNIQSNRAYPIGGNVYWVLAAHLYSKIPFISQQTSLAQAIRLHAFANVGNLGNVGKRQGDFANFLFNDPLRASVGLGICLAFAGQARLELNYVLPVRSGIGDRVDERKAQFAFGVQYS